MSESGGGATSEAVGGATLEAVGGATLEAVGGVIETTQNRRRLFFQWERNYRNYKAANKEAIERLDSSQNGRREPHILMSWTSDQWWKILLVHKWNRFQNQN